MRRLTEMLQGFGQVLSGMRMQSTPRILDRIRIQFEPSTELREDDDGESKVWAATEFMMLNALRNKAETLEFRTIEDEFRVAAIIEDQVYEWPQPPLFMKGLMLGHLGKLLGKDATKEPTRFSITFGDGQSEVRGFVNHNENQSIWIFTSINVSVSKCDELLARYQGVV